MGNKEKPIKSTSLSSQSSIFFTIWVLSVYPTNDPPILLELEHWAFLFAFGTYTLSSLTGFCLLLFEIEMNESYFSWEHIFENFMTPFRNLKIVRPMVWLWDHVWGILTFEANNISAQLAPMQLSCQIQPCHSRSLCQRVQKHKSNLILAQKSNKCLNWISMEFVLIRLSMQTAL